MPTLFISINLFTNMYITLLKIRKNRRTLNQELRKCDAWDKRGISSLSNLDIWISCIKFWIKSCCFIKSKWSKAYVLVKSNQLLVIFKHKYVYIEYFDYIEKL